MGVGQIAGSFRQIDRRLAHRLRNLAAFDGLDKLAKIPGDIVNSLEKLRLRLGSEHQVQLPNVPSLGIDLEKLIAQQ